MMAHPLILAVLLLDVLLLALIGKAAVKATRIALSWAPISNSRRQLQLERYAETAAIEMHWALVLSGLSTLTMIVLLTNVLPPLVPGAMCGTGVLEAMGGRGGRAIALRLLTFSVLYLWKLIENLNRTCPQAPLTPRAARMVLLALPLAGLTWMDTLRACLHLNPVQPVSCCALIYDDFRSALEAKVTAGWPDSFWLTGWLVGALAVAAMALMIWKGRKSGRGSIALLVLAALVWTPLAAIALVKVLSAYYYEVLAHHCPWCLFLPVYFGAGFALFGLLWGVGLETAGAWLARRCGQRVPQVAANAAGRVRTAGLRVALGVLLFLLLSGGPALLWRARFGVWLQ